MTIDENLLVLLLALLLDRIAGDPQWLWSRMPHPVVVFGAAISYADRQLNPASLTGSQRRMNGIAAILALLLLTVAAGFVFNRFFALFGPVGILLETGLVAIFLAQKSLADHVAAVALALRDEGLTGGRAAVSRIVGRDPETLDEPAVCRAAIESLAENFSDGVVAPALWYAVFGLPGLFAYKMLNTADSMIGHKSEKYIDFGWAAARLDDVANWPAARLSILLIAAGAWIRRGTSAGREAIRVAMRDGALHRSPNSGRPEAAMAGALNVQLAGPRIYGGVIVREPMINDTGRDVATSGDIEDGVSVFYASCMVLAGITFGLFLCFL
ncbi:cobalamin biosynthesis protein [Rhizobium ruizarguesonis]|jgi:adenosylcobinamide-phosphate synthase|uniref:Cobalamin biosynthesis protein CobD n=1 Tax=Rhizobium ruizarguesonis TaxID=2081791 RepID=A0AAE8QEJ3_9HYPH|nr:adenosylcobinamide-phosphate synthase CbiB [Rhizobium ruizarguesonis]MBY5806651.1 cobalamin biosynthesis protein [Rhizobium leguminosarum]NKL11096.1 cobalamin biosynthesis protein [Rhizobium leguminosarum bv. viciae]QIO43142.1 cobalamin biosynthesis protein [Rhizobium leguminosarum bv. trifolii]MBY5846508.1 cobalamin biosynthesis protein [Rhizobium leguminosarum]MBY5882303.1 cobalamin biosynthesis protein [Rhizobium leguminosarum]